MIKVFALLLSCLLYTSSFANDLAAQPQAESKDLEANHKAVFLGHLLTPTTYLPKKNTATVGTHVAGFSLNDNLLIGSSSFLHLFYNSPNLFLKYGRQFKKKHRWALQFDYLKSTEKNLSGSKGTYKMEALMLWGLWSYDVSPLYTIHYSLNYMYFINEGKPHSLRREPFNDQAFQFSLTSLHEIKISKRYGIATEIGFLGLNYTIPNLHGALTFRYKTKRYLLQAGVSFDKYLWGPTSRSEEYSFNNPVLDDAHRTSVITHPEMGFQYYF